MIKLTIAAISLLNISNGVQAEHMVHHSQKNSATVAELQSYEAQPNAQPKLNPFKNSQLAQVDSEAERSSDSGGAGIGAFILGLFMIPFTLVLIWKNEKKIVMYAKVVSKAKASLQHDVKAAIEDHDNALVHTVGESHTDETLKEEDFAIEVQNSYKLVRECEMLQWIEQAHRRDNQPTTYTYSLDWRSHPVSSGLYHDQSKSNPSGTWPFESKTTLGEQVHLNGYKLNQSQVERLGVLASKNFDTESAAVTITTSSIKMKNSGFSVFRHFSGQYFHASHDGSEVQDNQQKAGTYRVSFKSAPCAQATVVAQQVECPEGFRTFRKWNPKKLNVPYGTETSADADTPCIDNFMLCCICICVNKIMNFAMEEVVDGCVNGSMTFEEFFAKEDGKVKTLAKCVRPIAIVCHILGWFCLFIPAITLLKWIPLVGALLGFAATVAALIFSVVWGGTIACLVTAIAWVVFRPLFGICLLTLVGLSIYLIFFLPGGEKDKESLTPV